MRISTVAHQRQEAPPTGGGTGAIAGQYELSDAAVARAARLSAEIGVPSILLLVVCVALLAGQGLGVALTIAVVPGVFAGPYFGTIVSLSRAERAAARDAGVPATVHPMPEPGTAATRREAA